MRIGLAKPRTNTVLLALYSTARIYHSYCLVLPLARSWWRSCEPVLVRGRTCVTGRAYNWAETPGHANALHVVVVSQPDQQSHVASQTPVVAGRRYTDFSSTL